MCGDTLASEIGPVMGVGKVVASAKSSGSQQQQVFHVIKWKRVPKGTNGGISFCGTVASFVGGLVVGLGYYVTLKICLFIGSLEPSSIHSFFFAYNHH